MLEFVTVVAGRFDITIGGNGKKMLGCEGTGKVKEKVRVEVGRRTLGLAGVVERNVAVSFGREERGKGESRCEGAGMMVLGHDEWKGGGGLSP